MDASKMGLSDIFDKNRMLKIPTFQRAYVWKEEDWERFLEDIIDIKDKDYFMGVIILKHQLIGRYTESEIVDGQQRLTTIFLFLKAILENGDEFASEIDFDFNHKSGDVILKHNYNDEEIFEAILRGKVHNLMGKRYKDNKVLNCYYYFRERLTNNDLKEKFKNINFNNILKHLFFICIDLDDDDNKQKIFDTMNSLGVKLTTGELLKNILFDESEKDFYVDSWRKTFEDDEYIKDFWDDNVLAGRSTRTHMDLLLQSFLLIKYPEHGERQYQRADKLFDNFKEVFDMHKILDDINAKKDFIKELMEYAKLYKEHIDPDCLQEALANNPKDNSITHRLNIFMFTMNSTSVIPFVLYILKTVENDEEKIEIFKLLETYLMRRVIAQEPSMNYGNYFSRHIRQGRNSYKQLYDKIYSSEDPTSYMPTNESLKNSFGERKFTNSAARLILYFLESHKRPQESATGLLAINNYNVEHVMPKKWNKNWSGNLPEGDRIETEQERNELIYRLGNLTLVTPKLNSSLSNADWGLKKIGRKDEKGKRDLKGLQECCDGIATFSRYLTLDDWNEEAIKERGKDLLEVASDLWEYDGQVLGE